MSTQERYTQIIESLVNGNEADASDLLHEAFVEKAREIWSDLVEQDEIVEDDISDEELEEAISDEEADDFLSDIETTDEEIDSEEAFGEDDSDEDHEGEELEAEMELAVDDMEVDADDMEGEEEVEGVADAMVNVEDALSDLKLEFAKLMGDESEEPEMDMEMEPEMEETTLEEPTFEAATEETDEEVTEEADKEELEEAAELTAVNVDHADGSDGKSGPVASDNNEVESNGGPVDMSKGATEKGGKTPKSDSLGVDGPADVKELKKV
jgi:hypothetical protein|tara:strand:- start:3992 stop:4795 length:804 start_codon:yes stop_codon:yes gene_type:complete